MSKKVKIIGGIIISILVIFIIVIFILVSASRSMLSGTSSSFSSEGGVSFSNMDVDGSSSASIKSSSSRIISESVSQANDSVAIVDKKIIKNGNLSLKVDKVDDSVREISDIAKSNQGEIFSSNIRQNIKNIKNGSVTVKIPVANFEKAFSEIKEVASLVLNESTSGRDVTEQYSDLQAQLRNKRAEEAQFSEILKQATKIQDILAVTQQLSRVRGEIERLQGRIKYMDSQTEMSTISIRLSEDQDITVVDSWRPWQIIKGSVNSLIKNVQGSVNFIIKLIIIILPILIIWGVIIWLIYLIGKKIYLKIRK